MKGQFFITVDGTIWITHAGITTTIGTIPPHIVKFMYLNDVQLSLVLELMEKQQEFEECAEIRDEINRRNSQANKQ